MVAVHDPEVALQGSGEDVSPVDLLRLLGRSGRTGLIEFVGRSHATVGMVHGLLTFVRSASAPSLRQSLLARGVVTEDQWELASLGGGSDVLDALAHNGDCDPAQLRAALREQIVNGLFEVQLNCHDRFRFLARENQPVPSRLSYPVEPSWTRPSNGSFAGTRCKPGSRRATSRRGRLPAWPRRSDRSPSTTPSGASWPPSTARST